jgi:hypothetical protein
LLLENATIEQIRQILDHNVQILHLDLKAVAGNYVESRYFTDNYNKYETRKLPLSEISDLIELVERDYYVSLFAEDYAVTGKRLYNWLDGSDRWLQKLINQYQRQISVKESF